ncbi:MAG TPA: molybdopterin-binding protein [Gammaproteobacteria bacterium]|nr:molybdopterin-binding protein [Gammaproteobacteria bacterium]
MTAAPPPAAESPTACLIIIGNEILSGKTRDANLQFIAEELGKLGVRFLEARVIPDIETTIIATVNELRAKYTHVFTTGGIGPTHDDITALAVAKAFGRELVLDPVAVERMQRGKYELNAARLKMAHVPRGASLIENPTSFAPGFKIENVYVLAGIPSVARAMFGTLVDHLRAGNAISSASVDVFLREGDIAAPLEAIALSYPDLDVGSYPFSRDGRYGANLVVRGTDPERIAAAIDAIIVAMIELGGPESVGPRG